LERVREHDKFLEVTMRFNESEHRTCSICARRLEVGARMVWVGKAWAHYECRHPEAAARAEKRAEAERRQPTLF
jgi:hypothetical protein